MERFASAADSSVAASCAGGSPGAISAIRHGLAWLFAGNAIGVMLAILLLLPGLNVWLGEWTYGRWMMVHMNIALFGWCSLPMVGLLFKAYRLDESGLGAWGRPVVWLWSAALLAGSISWLEGHSSGKLFLDWTGYARVFFPLALFCLWLLLAAAFFRSRDNSAARMAKGAGLVALLAVPFALYVVSNPSLYPAFNPATGGPTGESQLESTLGIVLILLALPLGMTRRARGAARTMAWIWTVFVLESILCGFLGHGDVSHRVPAQYLGLGSVLVWMVLVPMYYRRFEWSAESKRWRTAFLWWWGGLVITGWIVFLPGVLDRAKFTDILVGHSLAAVAGFLSAFILFVIAEVAGSRNAWIVNRTWSFYAWNLGVLAYVLVMLVAGWIEGSDPSFTIVPGTLRNVLYTIRLLTGISMLAGSAEWLFAARFASAGSSSRQLETANAEVA